MPPERFLGLTQTGWAGVAAIVSALTVIGAVVAVIAAFKQVGAVRRAHEDQTRPHVIVDFESNPAWWMLMDLVVKNIGQTSAVDVRIAIDPRPERTDDASSSGKFADAKLLNEPIPIMAPGREYRLFFDGMVERLNTDLPMVYTATVTYRAHGVKKPWIEKQILDLGVQHGSEQITTYGLHDAAKALREIRDVLKRAPILRGPVEAIVEDREVYRARRQAERDARMQRHRELVDQVLPKEDGDADDQEGGQSVQ